MVNKNEVINKIMPVIERTVKSIGLTVIEADFKKEAGKWLLKIFIYNPNAPITHEDCQNVTRSLNDYLDELIEMPYSFEVSSPGLDRKLKTEKEYVIFKGKKAKVKLKNGDVFITEINDELKEKFLKNEVSYTRLEPEYKF